MCGHSESAFNLSGPALENFAATKIKSAISNTLKKDYYDLFELLNVYTFVELMDFYSNLYPNWDIAGTLKSLSDFKTVELEDEEPFISQFVSWNMVRDKISTEIKNYVRMLQQTKINVENAG